VSESTWEEFARRGDVVVMAGAGVSAGWPSAVPSWYPLNAAIFGALRERLEAGIDRPGWLEQVESDVVGARAAGRFPPDYQAQVIEDMCGLRYFQGLQALDIDVGNSAHEAIAALAAGSALRAIVTTNFDRLIERALERRGVAFVSAFDEDGYASLPTDGTLPVIKVHGSVSSAESMIDTWKQRRRGRSQRLIDCLAPLHDAFWIYAGFSAADLEDDENYLGLIAGAARGPGAIYIAYPGSPELGPGAQALMGAYGERGAIVVADVAEQLGAPATAADEPIGSIRVQAGLKAWADGLTVSAAGLCVAAILEAVGAGEPAVRVLDRLVRKALFEERNTPDFRALQLAYGRLGGALGRFIAVPDLDGAASNASVESVQSLLRVKDSEVGFLARVWLGPMHLWQGRGRDATALAVWILQGFHEDGWDGPQPRSDEEIVDAWMSAAQVLVFNSSRATIEGLDSCVGAAIERAQRSGDVVREARAAATRLLVLSEADVDLPALADAYEPLFTTARRVNDPVAFGFRALALGRWHLELERLNEAAGYFKALGMDPWLLFARIHAIRALAALERYDDVNRRLEQIELERFPVLETFLFEALAQTQALAGDDRATQSLATAADCALGAGLNFRYDRLAAAD
jgi:SIR2-like domain